MLALYLNEIEEGSNKQKFEVLYFRYSQKMFSVAYGILHHKENAEDAVHDAFEVMIKKLDVIGDVDSQETWNYIMVIVKHKAIRIYNRRKKRGEVLTDDFNILDDLAEELAGVEAQIEGKELSDILAHMILELPERCRSVLYLHYYNEMSYAEIGEALDLTEANARQIARRSRKMLAEKMAERGIHYA